MRDRSVIDGLQAIVTANTRWGSWACYDALRFGGREWNHKHVHRVYGALRLQSPRRTRRRVPQRIPTLLVVAPRTPVLERDAAVQLVIPAPQQFATDSQFTAHLRNRPAELPLLLEEPHGFPLNSGENTRRDRFPGFPFFSLVITHLRAQTRAS